MASSTTRPVARTMASRVRMLMENPAMYMMKKAPISDIGIAMTGIRVVRQFRRKMKMTRTTSRNGDEDGLLHLLDGLADGAGHVHRQVHIDVGREVFLYLIHPLVTSSAMSI